MTSAPPQFSWSRPLIINSWEPPDSGRSKDLFPPGTQITITPGNEEEYRLSWTTEGIPHHMDLPRMETKLQKGNVTIYAGGEPVLQILEVTIYPLLGDPAWSRRGTWRGTLKTLLGGGEGNTGVFIAHQDPPPPPYEPEDEKGTSTAE